MLKRKDNLTDFVEKLPKVEVAQTPKPEKEQVVVNADGELVTLANKDKRKKYLGTYRKSFELQKIIKETVELELDKLGDKIVDKVEKELKKRRLI